MLSGSCKSSHLIRGRVGCSFCCVVDMLMSIVIIVQLRCTLFAKETPPWRKSVHYTDIRCHGIISSVIIAEITSLISQPYESRSLCLSRWYWYCNGHAAAALLIFTFCHQRSRRDRNWLNDDGQEEVMCMIQKMSASIPIWGWLWPDLLMSPLNSFRPWKANQSGLITI